MKSLLEYPAELYYKARTYYWGNVLVAPVTWSVLLPALLLDLFVTIYQIICFPVYGIPKVKRRDYIIMDRGHLNYLNWDEKLSCVFCGYFNGLLAYCAEIASRTEQYWCPIKHRNTPKDIHKRYQLFLDYGDAENYRQRLDHQRKIVKNDQT